MNTVLSLLALINLLLIVVFIIATNFINTQKQPKLMAWYSVLLAVLFLIYFAAILTASFAALFAKEYMVLSLVFFVIIPFVIGKYVSYEKLSFYSNLQLFALFLSLFLTIFFINI